MIYKFFSSTKCCVKIPQLNWWLMHNIFDVAGSSFSCSLVLYMEVVSIVLCTDNPVTSSPFKVPFARLLVFKACSVTNFKIRWAVVCCLCVCLNLFSSKVFLAMASVRWCYLMSRHPDSGSPRNCFMDSSNWWRVRLGYPSID